MDMNIVKRQYEEYMRRKESPMETHISPEAIKKTAKKGKKS